MRKEKTAWNKNDATPLRALESPLEPNVFLIPAGATEIEPPAFDPETHFCQFEDNAWVIREISKLEPTEEEEPEPYEPTYMDFRLQEYGSPMEQLEFITENGLEAWQQKVAEIKNKYPKPNPSNE